MKYSQQDFPKFLFCGFYNFPYPASLYNILQNFYEPYCLQEAAGQPGYKMDFIEVSAKTYEDAVTDALIQLGLTSDQVEIEVLVCFLLILLNNNI